MDLNQSTILGCAAGSIGLGLVALWSWMKLQTIIHNWEQVVCRVVTMKAEFYKSDGDTYHVLKLTFQTPYGTRQVSTPSAEDDNERAMLERTYAVGSEHTLYVTAKSSDAYLTPPWSSLNPTAPAIMSVCFAALGFAVYMGWYSPGG
ncbi:MAG TPA: hypothetical protein DCL54_00985 [Alphaproteobacteria bacterium]|nr:hypothetical protein [Alphaproteobacteria bacterium]HAJ45141.1 hypothetical protein [Alphaproteobacteria bacterium]